MFCLIGGLETEVEELRYIIKLHGKKYPEMQAEDLIKLIYQGEFGAEADISDPDKTLKEISALMDRSRECPGEELVTDIGGGFVRLSLYRAKTSGLTPEAVNAAHILSLAHVHGDKKRLEEKLSRAAELICEDNPFSFTPEEFKSRVSDYLKQGGGAVEHSPAYRERYGAEYAVVARWLTQEWCAAETDL